MRKAALAGLMGRCGGGGLAAAVLATLLVTGCGRTLTIHQDPFLNTAPHASRPADKRTGEPLELDVVVLNGNDLAKPENELLRPGSRITAKDWFERRPQRGVEKTGNRFDVPADQVYVLTNDTHAFGRQIGTALRGAALDGDRPIVKSNSIALRWGAVHDEHSVIYVFPMFTNKEGAVLPVAPAMFHPPGAYSDNLEIRVGVEPNRPLEEAQYIRVVSPRKLYGKSE
jgi:hypothetical protein